MGGCIRRLWKFIPDVDDSESDPICRKEDLTEYELALQKGLVRFGAVVLLCFFINLTLCIYDYESSGEYQDPQDFVISMVTLLPMVPQFAFSMRFRFTRLGRTLRDLSWFRVLLIFFLLMNITRLYSKVSTDGLLCKLSDEAFSNPSEKPSSTRCSSAFQGVATASILIYVIFTLLQTVCVQKLELSFRRRTIRANLKDIMEKTSLASMADFENGASETVDPEDNNI